VAFASTAPIGFSCVLFIGVNDDGTVEQTSKQPNKVKTNFAAYLSIPIDIELWDKAGWRGTFFMSGGGRPPLLGLMFLDHAAAQKIFEGWHKRYGERDEYEELRISIIEGEISGEEPGYTVHVGADYENTIKRYRDAGLKFDLGCDVLITATRMNRMNPSPESKNLERFKTAYREYKTYFLAPGVMKPDGSHLRLYPELGIYKSLIHFRHVNEISENDPDSIVLRTGRVDRPRSGPGGANAWLL
jgi:hypothetical protein